ncbi:MAG: hypothetical protein IPK53_12385 [bacterium]|nr:hypothetical protein [bacterium]
MTRDLIHTQHHNSELVLNYLTPHGKWHIHSTFGDTCEWRLCRAALSPCGLMTKTRACLAYEINDWVEVINDHGVVVTRANVSARPSRDVHDLSRDRAHLKRPSLAIAR